MYQDSTRGDNEVQVRNNCILENAIARKLTPKVSSFVLTTQASTGNTTCGVCGAVAL